MRSDIHVEEIEGQQSRGLCHVNYFWLSTHEELHYECHFFLLKTINFISGLSRKTLLSQSRKQNNKLQKKRKLYISKLIEKYKTPSFARPFTITLASRGTWWNNTPNYLEISCTSLTQSANFRRWVAFLQPHWIAEGESPSRIVLWPPNLINSRHPIRTEQTPQLYWHPQNPQAQTNS